MSKAKDWHELTELTQGAPLIVERVRLADRDIVLEGAFELPQLARLALEDQVFIAAFVKSHGSIKEMEQVFGVSYPTIKARLNRIAASLEFVDTDPTPSRSEVLDRLNRGEITAGEAIAELEGKSIEAATSRRRAHPAQRDASRHTPVGAALPGVAAAASLRVGAAAGLLCGLRRDRHSSVQDARRLHCRARQPQRHPCGSRTRRRPPSSFTFTERTSR